MTFNFDLEKKDIDEAAFRDKIKGEVQEILDSAFTETERRRISEHSERLNFACPYCGDSYASSFKKRANIYFKDYGFHCFNCGTHKTLSRFLKDFNKEVNSSEKVFLFDVNQNQAQRRKSSVQKSYEYFVPFELLNKYAVSRDKLMYFYHLTEIDHCQKMKEYLENRFQKGWDKFAYDQKNDRLFIFNLTDKNKVLGFQIRNFNREPKYVTYDLSMIYKKLKLQIENQEEFEEADKLSFCFGLNTVDFSRDIIVTEGPLDSFLLNNGMCMCGLKNNFPFDLANVKYMYDYDEPGTKKSLEIAKQGMSVFMWKKYCKDSNINKMGKLDWTDVIKYQKEHNQEVLNPSNYFTSSKYDLFYIS